MKKLPTVQKGQAFSLQDADRANELFKVVNAMIETRIEPSLLGEIKDQENARIIDLTRLADYIDARIEEQVNSIIDNNLGISAVCNADGTLTVTLTRE